MPPLPNDRKPSTKCPKKRPLNVEDDAIDGDATKIWIAACKRLKMSLNDYLWLPEFNDVLPVDQNPDGENGDQRNDEEEKRPDKSEGKEDKLHWFLDDLCNQETSSAANAEGHRSSIHSPVDNPISADMPGQPIEKDHLTQEEIKQLLSDILGSRFSSSADAHGTQAAISIDAGTTITTADVPMQPLEKADPNFAMDDEIKQRFSDDIGSGAADSQAAISIGDPTANADPPVFSNPRVDRIYHYVYDVLLCYLKRLSWLRKADIESELTRYEFKANEVWGGFLQNSLQVQELFEAHELVNFQKYLENACLGTCTLIRRFRERWQACGVRYGVLEDVAACIRHGYGDRSELVRGKNNAKNMVSDLRCAAVALMDCLKVIRDLYDLLKEIKMRRRSVRKAKRKSINRRG